MRTIAPSIQVSTVGVLIALAIGFSACDTSTFKGKNEGATLRSTDGVGKSGNPPGDQPPRLEDDRTKKDSPGCQIDICTIDQERLETELRNIRLSLTKGCQADAECVSYPDNFPGKCPVEVAFVGLNSIPNKEAQRQEILDTQLKLTELRKRCGSDVMDTTTAFDCMVSDQGAIYEPKCVQGTCQAVRRN